MTHLWVARVQLPGGPLQGIISFGQHRLTPVFSQKIWSANQILLSFLEICKANRSIIPPEEKQRADVCMLGFVLLPEWSSPMAREQNA